MNPTRAVCTIFSKNYLAFARTMIQSVLRRHPDVKCYGLVFDQSEGFVNPAEEAFELISLEQLKIPEAEKLCFKYTAMGLASSLKPVLLKFLVSRAVCANLLYLDPDIFVTGSLDGLFDDLSRGDVVMTPHLDRDFPNDGLKPDDAVILTTGVFNGGCIGIKAGPNAESFLDWWAAKLADKCILDIDRGYFFDQKFLDIAFAACPGIWVDRDPGYNVGYWNLHGRRLRLRDRRWLCNDGPMHFFHFSGYSVESPGAISRWSTRHRLSDMPDLQPLFDQYRASVLANGYEQSKHWPYTFGQFESGQPITDWVRREYRNSPERWEGNPFASESLEFFDRKKREPINDFDGFMKAVRRKLHPCVVSASNRLFREGGGQP